MSTTFAQVSVEYLMIIGFVVVITVPLLIIYYNFTSDSKDEIVSIQLNQIAVNIVDAAESVYFLGAPSQTTLRIYIPDTINNASLSNREVFFRIQTKKGYSEIIQVSSVNLSGALPTTHGFHDITIKASNGYVQVS